SVHWQAPGRARALARNGRSPVIRADARRRRRSPEGALGLSHRARGRVARMEQAQEGEQMSIMPRGRPGITQERAGELLKRRGVPDRVALLGLRGYYRDTMGKKGRNDRGLYDDAIVLVGP